MDDLLADNSREDPGPNKNFWSEQHEELVDKLDKMLKMRGKTLHSDLLSLMSTWVAEVGGQDKNRKSQDQTVSTVEDFVRSTAVRSISDLMQVDAKERSFWPEDELDDKKVIISPSLVCLLPQHLPSAFY